MSYKTAPQQSPNRVPYNSVPQECPTNALQECAKSRKSALQECPTTASHDSVLHKIHKSVPHNVRQERQQCPARMSQNSGPQDCPTKVCPRRMPFTGVSSKSVARECLTCVRHQPVQSEECRTRVSGISHKCDTSVFYKRVLECHPRMPCFKSVKKLQTSSNNVLLLVFA